MKKLFSFLVCLGILSVFSCKNEEEDIFGKSSAVRLNEAVADYTEYFKSAPNGWRMEYYPTSSSKGYNYVVKFNENGSVLIGTRNEWTQSVYKEDTSLWEVIADDGPVLTFNSYNDVFHLFSSPLYPGNSEVNKGTGLGGDYEFIILQPSEDKNVITLKGKKRSAYIRLTKLEENENWKDIFDKVDLMNSLLFATKVPHLVMYTEAQPAFTMANGVSSIFLATPWGGDPITDGESRPFIITPSGIRLYEAMEVNGIEVQAFDMNEEKNALVCVENNGITLTGPNPLTFYADNANWLSGRLWKMDATDVGGDFKTDYMTIVENCKSKYKEDFNSFSFKYVGTQESRTLSFKSGKYEGAYNIDINVDEANGTISFVYKEVCDKNGAAYLQNIDGFKEFIATLCEGTYKVRAESAFIPTDLTFISTANASNWFKVHLN